MQRGTIVGHSRPHSINLLRSTICQPISARLESTGISGQPMTTQTSTARTVYRFGLFEVDERTGEMRKQGRPLKLRGRPFDILVLLLRRGGDVVSREELRQ